MGFVSDAQTAKAGRKQAIAEGNAQKDAFYKNAKNKEIESASMLNQSGKAMEVMRKNQNQGISQANAVTGATGLTSEGSNSMRALSVAEQFEQQIANQMEASALQDISNRYDAEMLRWQGDSAMAQAQTKANMYKAQERGAYMQGAFQIGGAVLGGAIAGGSLKSIAGGAFQGWHYGGLASIVVPYSGYNSSMGSALLGQKLGISSYDRPSLASSI